MQMFTVAVTTDASGDFEATLHGVAGKFHQLSYVPHATTPIDTNGDLDIAGDTTGVVLANHDNIGTSAFTKCYRQATHGVDGSASLYAATGEPVEDLIAVYGEPVTLTIANGGDTKSGTFYLLFIE